MPQPVPLPGVHDPSVTMGELPPVYEPPAEAVALGRRAVSRTGPGR